MKRLIALVAVAFIAIGCGNQSEAEKSDRRLTDSQQDHYSKVQPIPFFDFSADRDTFIQIYKAKNEARQTWAVFSSNGTGEARFSCPSIGFAIPADAQLTNPEKLVYGGSEGASGPLPQAEPDGLYSSTNTDGTYVLCVRPNGDIAPVYTELKVTTFPFEVSVRDGEIIDGGGVPTMTIDVRAGAEGPTPSAAP